MIQVSDRVLDCIATNLSQFTKPNIPKLVLDDDGTLQNNFLDSIFDVFVEGKNAHNRSIMTNIVRRVFASIEFYRYGRKYAFEYIDNDNDLAITPYFQSLTYFEGCISYSWQVCDLLNALTNEMPKIYKKGDGTVWERLHDIYTHGTKHSNDKFNPHVHETLPTTIWLTNDGIESVDSVSLTFIELNEIIIDTNQIFYEFRKKMRPHNTR